MVAERVVATPGGDGLVAVAPVDRDLVDLLVVRAVRVDRVPIDQRDGSVIVVIVLGIGVARQVTDERKLVGARGRLSAGLARGE